MIVRWNLVEVSLQARSKLLTFSLKSLSTSSFILNFAKCRHFCWKNTFDSEVNRCSLARAILCDLYWPNLWHKVSAVGTGQLVGMVVMCPVTRYWQDVTHRTDIFTDVTILFPWKPPFAYDLIKPILLFPSNYNPFKFVKCHCTTWGFFYN